MYTVYSLFLFAIVFAQSAFQPGWIVSLHRHGVYSWAMNAGVAASMLMSSFLMTRSMSPYSTASSGCRYLTRWQSSMTTLSGFPVACAMSSHDVFRLCATSLARMAMSDACPCPCDLGWLSWIVALGSADLPPFCPWLSIIAAAPKACPMATVLTGGRMYFMTSAMANASVSNP